MKKVSQIRNVSIWIFILPVAVINLCLFLSVNHHLFEDTIFIVDQIELIVSNNSLFLIFYSIFRFICETFREPDPHIGLQYFNLSLGQIYSIFFLIVGIALFLKKNKWKI